MSKRYFGTDGIRGEVGKFPYYTGFYAQTGLGQWPGVRSKLQQ